jgi:Aspartyl protease
MRTPGLWQRLRRGGLIASMLSVLTFGAAALAAQPSDPSGQPAGVLTTAQLRYQSLLACPTTLDHIGRVVVPVLVDGRGPFRFVIDTGASHSTISPRLVRTLGLTMSKVPLIDLEGVTGSAAVPAVTIKSLRAGALVIRDQAVPVLSTPMMAGADGILGIAGIPNVTLQVDFEHNRVRIARQLSPDVRFDDSRAHTQAVAGGLMAIPAYVGGLRVLAIIDTGSERSLGNAALRAALHLASSPGRLEPVTAVYGATQQVEMGRLVNSPIISVGPLRIAGVSLIYGRFHIFKVWGLEHRPAMILGMDVLGTVAALGFDFPRHDLFVAGVRRSPHRFPGGSMIDESPVAHENATKIH